MFDQTPELNDLFNAVNSINSDKSDTDELDRQMAKAKRNNKPDTTEYTVAASIDFGLTLEKADNIDDAEELQELLDKIDEVHEWTANKGIDQMRLDLERRLNNDDQLAREYCDLFDVDLAVYRENIEYELGSVA